MSDAARVLVMTADEVRAMLRDAAREGAELALRTRDGNAGMLTHAQTAHRLGMSTHALHRRVAAGDITPRKKGGRDGVRSNLFALEDVEAYVQRHGR